MSGIGFQTQFKSCELNYSESALKDAKTHWGPLQLQCRKISLTQGFIFLKCNVDPLLLLQNVLVLGCVRENTRNSTSFPFHCLPLLRLILLPWQSLSYSWMMPFLTSEPSASLESKASSKQDRAVWTLIYGTAIHCIFDRCFQPGARKKLFRGIVQIHTYFRRDGMEWKYLWFGLYQRLLVSPWVSPALHEVSFSFRHI